AATATGAGATGGRRLVRGRLGSRLGRRLGDRRGLDRLGVLGGRLARARAAAAGARLGFLGGRGRRGGGRLAAATGGSAGGGAPVQVQLDRLGRHLDQLQDLVERPVVGRRHDHEGL